MKRKSLLAGFFLVAIGGLSLGAFLTMPPSDRPGVTKANFDRIETGMTEAEVRAIFGKGPSLLYVDGHGAALFSGVRWMADNGATAHIEFEGFFGQDEVARVCSMTWHESPETPLQRICRLLHLPRG